MYRFEDVKQCDVSHISSQESRVKRTPCMEVCLELSRWSGKANGARVLSGRKIIILGILRSTRLDKLAVNPAFAGGGGVKRPHFFRRVITPVWRGAAAPNFG